MFSKYLPASLRRYWRILQKAVLHFLGKNVLTQSAALSYYTIFSLPPMLLIVMEIASQFYDSQEVRSAIFSEIGQLVGREGARQLQQTMERLNIFEPTWWATVVGIGFLLFTATTVFITLQNALNNIFEVRATQLRGSSILKLLRDRLVSFALLVSMAFILLVSLIVDALLNSFSDYLEKWIGELSTLLVLATSFLLPLAVITLLFAMLFKFLPDAKLRWSDTWMGALVTALLFALGKYLIGFYIGNSRMASLYDAAGSLLVVMLWVYYTSAIFLFGATFTFARAEALEHEVRPANYAEKLNG